MSKIRGEEKVVEAIQGDETRLGLCHQRPAQMKWQRHKIRTCSRRYGISASPHLASVHYAD